MFLLSQFEKSDGEEGDSTASYSRRSKESPSLLVTITVKLDDDGKIITNRMNAMIDVWDSGERIVSSPASLSESGSADDGFIDPDDMSVIEYLRQAVLN